LRTLVGCSWARVFVDTVVRKFLTGDVGSSPARSSRREGKRATRRPRRGGGLFPADLPVCPSLVARSSRPPTACAGLARASVPCHVPSGSSAPPGARARLRRGTWSCRARQTPRGVRASVGHGERFALVSAGRTPAPAVLPSAVSRVPPSRGADTRTRTRAHAQFLMHARTAG